jgi:drug/metabolite transporter (DMT)-like permease
MDGRKRSDWRRILGGGCLTNLVITGLLVILMAILASFSIDNIAWPFLLGATLSFGGYLFFLRNDDAGANPMRKLVLSVVGVLLGSIVVVIGIAAYILLIGSLN